VSKFAYTAIDQNGKETFGIVDAEDEKEALDEINILGLIPTDVHEAHVGDELRLKWREQKEQRQVAEARHKEQARAKHPRQRLVVRYADGRTDYGVCYALNPREPTFHLDRVGPDGRTTGETIQIRFSELKALFHVKSFDGKFDKKQQYPDLVETGPELVVEFEDGETIHGLAARNYAPDMPRFFLVPKDGDTNNIAMLVERAATRGVYDPESFRKKKEQEREQRRKDGGTDLTQEESMGDFYFETRNYEAAMAQYQAALKKSPESGRLRRKLLATRFNIGVQFIKKREYPRALAIMEEILKVDPNNAHAKKKIEKLRKVVERQRESKGA
jgi:tetratricopeptide (TPR) repeat protein